ncbi:MAG: hypothetical protein II702_03205 [Clostridia bacterium]|jgi:hypothetical protein|nr:hypothetical protein [Clostridia bacterium]
MLMKLLRIAVAALTAVTVIAFLVVFIDEKVTSDKTVPVIKIEEGVLEVNVNAKEADLLKGVTAFDKKDGDLTGRVIVESIGKFTETGSCKVTYAVSDSDNHVTTAQRRIRYTNYTPPKFTMKQPLLFSVYKQFNIMGIVGATDCLDGDISQNVIISSQDFEQGKEGVYTLKATVMNSKGDTSEIELPILVEKTGRDTAEIELKQYLVYVEKGKTPDWKSYVKATYDSLGLKTDIETKTQTDFKAGKPGVYSVDYYATDEYGYVGHTRLIAVVE